MVDNYSMNIKKKVFVFFFGFVLCAFIPAEILYSPTWGFSLDIPEDYSYIGGDNKDRFSFMNQGGAQLDLAVYYAPPGGRAPYASVEAMAQDVHRRLNNRGGLDTFEYRQKKVVVLELDFFFPEANGRTTPMKGWALCIELAYQSSRAGGSAGANNRASAQPGARPLLLAIAYGPANKPELMALNFSVLDSIAPEEADKYAVGPITEYSFPRETRIIAPVYGLGVEALIYKEDPEAAQSLIDREFQVLLYYHDSPYWQDAWIRFYRAIYRDSFERLGDIAFQVERRLNVPERENLDLADQALGWVQSFSYERNLVGSDFVNLVSAAVEGRGDCDSRAMLWSIVLQHANIPSAIMVSKHYGHAMGLADLAGSGARFELGGKRYLVAETTAPVSIGLIGENVSEVTNWLGIDFW